MRGLLNETGKFRFQYNYEALAKEIYRYFQTNSVVPEY